MSAGETRAGNDRLTGKSREGDQRALKRAGTVSGLRGMGAEPQAGPECGSTWVTRGREERGTVPQDHLQWLAGAGAGRAFLPKGIRCRSQEAARLEGALMAEVPSGTFEPVSRRLPASAKSRGGGRGRCPS